jgi:phosphatidylinositol alpha-1,6-mannosyltransferase
VADPPPEMPRDDPRVLVVTNDFLPTIGGIQHYVDQVLARMPGVAVVAPAHPDAAVHDVGLPYPVVRARPTAWWQPTPGNWLLPTREVVDLVRGAATDHRAEVVVFAAPWPLAAMAPQLDLPVVVMTHGAELVMPARIPGPAHVLARHLGRADLVTTVSRWTGRHVLDLVGPQGPPIRVVPPGVDLAHFTPAADGAAIRARHGIGDAPTAVFVGRHVPRKGLDVLVEHWPEVRARVPGARLLVTGSGRLTDGLADTAAAHGDDGVVLAGRVPWDELPAHHAAGDVFVHPNRSRWGGLEQEGFGIIFLEAQAVGRPVVAGNSGGAPETLVPGRTGLLVDGDDPGAVVAAVAQLLADPERAAAMGRAGRAFVRDHFDWDRIVARFAADLATLAAGATPGSDLA